MNAELKNWLFEHHKEAYLYQLARIDPIGNRVSLLSGLLTLLGGAIAYVILHYPHHWDGLISLLFYAPAGAASLLHVISILFILFVISWGFRYSYVRPSTEIQENAEALWQFSQQYPTEVPSALAELKDQLALRYSEGATHNWQVNTKRWSLLLIATRIAAVSILLLLSSFPYFLNRVDLAAPTQVSFKQPILIKMSDSGTSDPTKPQATPAETQPAQQPPSAPATPANAKPEKPMLAPNMYLTEAAKKAEEAKQAAERKKDK